MNENQPLLESGNSSVNSLTDSYPNHRFSRSYIHIPLIDSIWQKVILNPKQLLIFFITISIIISGILFVTSDEAYSLRISYPGIISSPNQPQQPPFSLNPNLNCSFVTNTPSQLIHISDTNQVFWLTFCANSMNLSCHIVEYLSQNDQNVENIIKSSSFVFDSNTFPGNTSIGSIVLDPDSMNIYIFNSRNFSFVSIDLSNLSNTTLLSTSKPNTPYSVTYSTSSMSFFIAKSSGQSPLTLYSTFDLFSFDFDTSTPITTIAPYTTPLLVPNINPHYTIDFAHGFQYSSSPQHLYYSTQLLFSNPFFIFYFNVLTNTTTKTRFASPSTTLKILDFSGKYILPFLPSAIPASAVKDGTLSLSSSNNTSFNNYNHNHNTFGWEYLPDTGLDLPSLAGFSSLADDISPMLRYREPNLNVQTALSNSLQSWFPIRGLPPYPIYFYDPTFHISWFFSTSDLKFGAFSADRNNNPLSCWFSPFPKDTKPLCFTGHPSLLFDTDQCQILSLTNSTCIKVRSFSYSSFISISNPNPNSNTPWHTINLLSDGKTIEKYHFQVQNAYIFNSYLLYRSIMAGFIFLTLLVFGRLGLSMSEIYRKNLFSLAKRFGVDHHQAVAPVLWPNFQRDAEKASSIIFLFSLIISWFQIEGFFLSQPGWPKGSHPFAHFLAIISGLVPHPSFGISRGVIIGYTSLAMFLSIVLFFKNYAIPKYKTHKQSKNNIFSHTKFPVLSSFETIENVPTGTGTGTPPGNSRGNLLSLNIDSHSSNDSKLIVVPFENPESIYPKWLIAFYSLAYIPFLNVILPVFVLEFLRHSDDVTGKQLQLLEIPLFKKNTFLTSPTSNDPMVSIELDSYPQFLPFLGILIFIALGFSMSISGIYPKTEKTPKTQKREQIPSTLAVDPLWSFLNLYIYALISIITQLVHFDNQIIKISIFVILFLGLLIASFFCTPTTIVFFNFLIRLSLCSFIISGIFAVLFLSVPTEWKPSLFIVWICIIVLIFVLSILFFWYFRVKQHRLPTLLWFLSRFQGRDIKYIHVESDERSHTPPFSQTPQNPQPNFHLSHHIEYGNALKSQFETDPNCYLDYITLFQYPISWQTWLN